jgi:hypothetical protein
MNTARTQREELCPEEFVQDGEEKEKEWGRGREKNLRT